MKKIILITGASSGMGKATAARLLRAGHTVYCAARSVKAMADLKELGGHVLALDVTDEGSRKKAVAAVIKQQGHIDVLWNNAGFGLYGPVEDISLDQARYQYEVNIFGLAGMTQLVVPHMRKQKSGLIINTSSMAGRMYMPLGAWYHSTKHALEGFSDSLRLELEPFGINVVLLEPGLIDTGFMDEVSRNFPQKSVDGPYKTIVKGLMDSVQSRTIRGSSPELIADTVEKIIESDRPKTRYLVGAMAKPLVTMRRLLGDRLFDRFVMMRFKG